MAGFAANPEVIVARQRHFLNARVGAILHGPWHTTVRSAATPTRNLPDIGSDRPDPWWDVAPEERESRIELTSDTCVIDDEHFFIRGVLDIPVHEHDEDFGFGVWVSQKKENFLKYIENFESADIGPFFGWLCTRIRYYSEETLHLKTMAHFRGRQLRPRIELEPTDHPLAVSQREGISLQEAWRTVHHYDGDGEVDGEGGE